MKEQHEHGLPRTDLEEELGNQDEGNPYHIEESSIAGKGFQIDHSIPRFAVVKDDEIQCWFYTRVGAQDWIDQQ